MRLTPNSTGTLNNPFSYTGREFDSETGLYYYRARYYDPSAGRFLSEDRPNSTSNIEYPWLLSVRLNAKTYEERVSLQIRDSATHPEQLQQKVVCK